MRRAVNFQPLSRMRELANSICGLEIEKAEAHVLSLSYDSERHPRFRHAYHAQHHRQSGCCLPRSPRHPPARVHPLANNIFEKHPINDCGLLNRDALRTVAVPIIRVTGAPLGVRCLGKPAVTRCRWPTFVVGIRSAAAAGTTAGCKPSVAVDISMIGRFVCSTGSATGSCRALSHSPVAAL